MIEDVSGRAEPERDLTPAARRILDTASSLFYGHGIHAVGVERIAVEAGVTKKTLYDRFGSKEALVVAYLQHRMARWQAFVRDRLQRSRRRPMDRPLVVLDALEAWMVDNDRGCGFVNAYAELAGTSHAALAQISAEKRWVRDLYIRLVREAGLDEADRRGCALSLLHEGAIVEMTAGASRTALADARRTARLVLA